MGRDSYESLQAVNRAHERIRSWLETVHFRRALFGISERDVWKKIAELDALYTEALQAERTRYDTLLDHLTDSGATIEKTEEAVGVWQYEDEIRDD
ncbi:MAG: hypothetical protein IJQ02_13745 [Oscillospiraceae bacterium]|nr:hypothetical protein [Oscillospiraceae bacterium]